MKNRNSPFFKNCLDVFYVFGFGNLPGFQISLGKHGGGIVIRMEDKIDHIGRAKANIDKNNPTVVYMEMQEETSNKSKKVKFGIWSGIRCPPRVLTVRRLVREFENMVGYVSLASPTS